LVGCIPREGLAEEDRWLDATSSRSGEDLGWPEARSYPVRECLLIILNEEWEHRLYAERDLKALETRHS